MTVSVIKRWLSEATSLGDGTWSWPRFWWPFICIAILVAYFAIAALAISIVGYAIAIAVFGGLPVAVLMGVANAYGVPYTRADVIVPAPPQYATQEQKLAPVDNPSTDGFHVKR